MKKNQKEDEVKRAKKHAKDVFLEELAKVVREQGSVHGFVPVRNRLMLDETRFRFSDAPSGINVWDDAGELVGVLNMSDHIDLKKIVALLRPHVRARIVIDAFGEALRGGTSPTSEPSELIHSVCLGRCLRKPISETHDVVVCTADNCHLRIHVPRSTKTLRQWLQNFPEFNQAALHAAAVSAA